MMDFVAIDFETANAQRHSACAIGIAVVKNGILVESRYRLIRPRELYIDPFFTQIHGITEKMVAREPEFDVIWEEFKPYLENNMIVAHNASFDLSVLRFVLDAYRLPYPELNYTCSYRIARKVWEYEFSYKLNALAEKFGIDFRHHHAEEDAIVCAKVMLRAAKAMQVKTVGELLHSVEMAAGALYPGGYFAGGKNKAKKLR